MRAGKDDEPEAERLQLRTREDRGLRRPRPCWPSAATPPPSAARERGELAVRRAAPRRTGRRRPPRHRPARARRRRSKPSTASASVRAMISVSALRRASVAARILPTISARRDHALVGEMAAALGKGLVLDLDRGGARALEQPDRPLDVQRIAVAGVGVDDDRRRHALADMGERIGDLAHRDEADVGPAEPGIGDARRPRDRAPRSRRPPRARRSARRRRRARRAPRFARDAASARRPQPLARVFPDGASTVSAMITSRDRFFRVPDFRRDRPRGPTA